jgi:hypothetical protein
MLPLQVCSQVQFRPAQASEVPHAESPVDDGQHGWFAPPHAHVAGVVLVRHWRVALHEVPLQHACPGPPQPQVPFVQVRFVPQ